MRLLEKYRLYLRGQRGLAETSVRIYCDDLDSFRQFLHHDKLDFRDMDRVMIRSYLGLVGHVCQGRPGRICPGQHYP